MFICGDSSQKFQMYNEQKANGALTRNKSKCHNWNAEKVYIRSEISTYSHWEEKIGSGCEEEREGSPVLIFPLLSFRIVRMLAN